MADWRRWQLLRRFDFTIVDPVHPMNTFNYGVSIQSVLFMRIWKRETSL